MEKRHELCEQNKTKNGNKIANVRFKQKRNGFVFGNQMCCLSEKVFEWKRKATHWNYV